MAGGGPVPNIPTASIGGTLYLSANTPAAHRVVGVQLLRDFAVMSADTVVYYDRPGTILRKTTDTNGSVEFVVPVPPSGTVAYKLTLPNGATYTVNLADGDVATFDDIVEATYSIPDPSTLSANILAGLLNADNVAADNPFVTLSQLGAAGVPLEVVKDYALPADAVLVDQGATGDFSTLSEAIATLNATVTSGNRGKVAVRGNITETYQIEAQNYIDVFLQENTRVTVEGSFQGPAVMFNNVFDSLWQATIRRTATFIRKEGSLSGSNFGINFTNPIPGQYPMIRGIIFKSQTHNTHRGYGGYLRGVKADDCEFWGAGYDRAYGLFADGNVYITNCDGYGGDNTIGGSGGSVPCGIVLAPNMTGRVENSRGYGGNAGYGSEAHGIWVFNYSGNNAAVMIACYGYGGVSEGGFNDGINFHKSAQIDSINCVGISTWRGNGVGAYGQSGNYARYTHHNLVGLCRNMDTSATGWHGGNFGDGAWRDRLIGGRFEGSPLTAESCGANFDILVGYAGADADNAIPEFMGTTFIGGGAGREAQGLTTHLANCPAIRVRQNAIPIRFSGIHALSNINSPAIKIASTATVANLQFVGGDAKSMNPSTQRAIESDVTWNNATIVGMGLYGGISNNITPVSPTMAGSNFVL